MSKHALFKHGIHQGARYFNSTSRKKSHQNSFHVKRSETIASSNKNTETSNSDSHPEENIFSSNEQQAKWFQCQQSCSALQKHFSSDDEFELHNKYFHSEETQSMSQSQ